MGGPGTLQLDDDLVVTQSPDRPGSWLSGGFLKKGLDLLYAHIEVVCAT
jgi:hypothetical protein